MKKATKKRNAILISVSLVLLALAAFISRDSLRALVAPPQNESTETVNDGRYEVKGEVPEIPDKYGVERVMKDESFMVISTATNIDHYNLILEEVPKEMDDINGDTLVNQFKVNIDLLDEQGRQVITNDDSTFGIHVSPNKDYIYYVSTNGDPNPVYYTYALYEDDVTSAHDTLPEDYVIQFKAKQTDELILYRCERGSS